MGAVLLRIVGVLLILTAIAVPLSRAPDRAVETLVARWAPPPSDFVEVKGQLVHLRDEGPRDDPTPVLLLHGTASSLHTWEGWVKVLRVQRRVITLDLPGFGLTGPYAGQYPPGDCSGDGYARFVLDFLDVLKVQRVAIGGNSLGGDVAWRVAALAPERVDRLVLVDAGGLPFEPDAVPLGFLIARVPLLSRITEELLPRALVTQTVVSVYGHPEKITADLIDRYYELTLREGNRHALGLCMQQLNLLGDASRVAALKLPTLILWGGRDRLIPPQVAKDFEAAIAGSERVVFDDLGHVPQEEDPARTLAPVKVFLGLR